MRPLPLKSYRPPHPLKNLIDSLYAELFGVKRPIDPTTEVGEFLMDTLKTIDKIAYVRFASVYRDFQDEQAFMNELRSLDKPRHNPL